MNVLKMRGHSMLADPAPVTWVLRIVVQGSEVGCPGGIPYFEVFLFHDDTAPLSQVVDLFSTLRRELEPPKWRLTPVFRC